jgi:hypothetical protein
MKPKLLNNSMLNDKTGKKINLKKETKDQG